MQCSRWSQSDGGGGGFRKIYVYGSPELKKSFFYKIYDCGPYVCLSIYIYAAVNKNYSFVFLPNLQQLFNTREAIIYLNKISVLSLNCLEKINFCILKPLSQFLSICPSVTFADVILFTFHRITRATIMLKLFSL